MHKAWHTVISPVRHYPDFKGARLRFVQIGLGTNITFIQNLAGKPDHWSGIVHWLLTATSIYETRLAKGVGIEPVNHLAQFHARLAACLPTVEVVSVAAGEIDTNDAELYLLADEDAKKLVAQLHPSNRNDLKQYLSFIENMSSVGGERPEFPSMAPNIRERFRIKLRWKRHLADVWSYSTLARNLRFRAVTFS